MEEKKILTSKELADRWGVSVPTLRNWRVSGYGPKFHKRGLRCIIYMVDDVLAFEDENPALIMGGNNE